jgi:hypothetical protein
MIPGLGPKGFMGKLQRPGLLGALVISSLACAQQLPQLGNITPKIALTPAAMIRPVAQPCTRSSEPFDVDDYSGPFNQLVARFSQRVEQATVHVPHHHSGLRPCAMDAREKFRLFVDQQIDPINFVGAAWDAAQAQADWDDAPFGQGANGYSKRFAASVADNATSDFFGVFFYPAIFHQDPRYYRQGQGTVKGRLLHALEHRFVAVSDSGHPMFNFSEWFGTVSSKAVGNLYHPGNPRGFGPTASRVGFSVGNDMAWDVLREFWPEIAHKFKLPFRTHDEFSGASHAPASQPPSAVTPSPDSAAAVDLH